MGTRDPWLPIGPARAKNAPHDATVRSLTILGNHPDKGDLP